MTKRNLTLGFLILSSALMATSPAWADPSPSDKAASDVLFKDAKQLVGLSRFNEACPKFEESERLDPTPGTLLNLGDCYTAASPKRTASAWGAYRQAEAMARQRGDAARQEGAALRAQTIEPLLSKVTITVAPAVRVPGFEVKWDGQSVGAGMWGTAVPVDAVEHAIEASAPGKKSWAGKVLVKPGGGTMSVEVPPLAEAPIVADAGQQPQAVSSGRRTAGVVVGGIGVAGLLVGGVFGALTIAKVGDSKEYCSTTNGQTYCDPIGLPIRESAKSLAKVSDVALAIGGAAFVGGVILFLTSSSAKSPSSSALRVQLGAATTPSSAGFLLKGEW